MGTITQCACPNQAICRGTRLLHKLLQAFANCLLRDGEAILAVVDVHSVFIYDAQQRARESVSVRRFRLSSVPLECTDMESRKSTERNMTDRPCLRTYSSGARPDSMSSFGDPYSLPLSTKSRVSCNVTWRPRSSKKPMPVAMTPFASPPSAGDSNATDDAVNNNTFSKSNDHHPHL